MIEKDFLPSSCRKICTVKNDCLHFVVIEWCVLALGDYSFKKYWNLNACTSQKILDYDFNFPWSLSIPKQTSRGAHTPKISGVLSLYNFLYFFCLAKNRHCFYRPVTIFFDVKEIKNDITNLLSLLRGLISKTLNFMSSDQNKISHSFTSRSEVEVILTWTCF